MQVCTLLQTDNHASTSPLMSFTGRMPFLPPNQQRQQRYFIIIIYFLKTSVVGTQFPGNEKNYAMQHKKVQNHLLSFIIYFILFISIFFILSWLSERRTHWAQFCLGVTEGEYVPTVQGAAPTHDTPRNA